MISNNILSVSVYLTGIIAKSEQRRTKIFKCIIQSESYFVDNVILLYKTDMKLSPKCVSHQVC